MRQRDAPLPTDAMADHAGLREALQQVDDDEAGEHHALEQQQVGGVVPVDPGARRGTPVGHEMHGEHAGHENEEGPFGRDLDADGDQGRHRTDARFGESKESRRLGAEAVRGELRPGLTVEIEAEGIGEADALAGGADRGLDAPHSADAVERQESQGDRVADQENVNRSSHPADT
jgi:hypothetical protein